MPRSVEPEGDSQFAPEHSDDPLDDGLLTELQFILGTDADGVREWVSEHGPAAARAEYFGAWGDGSAET